MHLGGREASLPIIEAEMARHFSLAPGAGVYMPPQPTLKHFSVPGRMTQSHRPYEKCFLVLLWSFCGAQQWQWLVSNSYRKGYEVSGGGNVELEVVVVTWVASLLNVPGSLMFTLLWSCTFSQPGLPRPPID